MTTPKNQTVLITGASSGIGADFANIFAENGFNLVLVARREAKLEEQKMRFESEQGIKVTVIAKDLAKLESADEVYATLQESNISVDILVNNAGFGAYGPFVDSEIQTEIRMMQLNMVTLTQLTKLFVKDMVKRGAGKILNVASTAAYQPGPLMAVYYATKAYVFFFAEALAEELCGTGVTLTTLCPGPTITEFQDVADIQGMRLLKKPMVMDSPTVARQGYEAVMKGRRLITPGWPNKLVAFSARIAPRWLSLKIVRQLMLKVKH